MEVKPAAMGRSLIFKELVSLRVLDAARTRMPQNSGDVNDLISEAALFHRLRNSRVPLV